MGGLEQCLKDTYLCRFAGGTLLSWGEEGSCPPVQLLRTQCWCRGWEHLLCRGGGNPRFDSQALNGSLSSQEVPTHRGGGTK